MVLFMTFDFSGLAAPTAGPLAFQALHGVFLCRRSRIIRPHPMASVTAGKANRNGTDQDRAIPCQPQKPCVHACA